MRNRESGSNEVGGDVVDEREKQAGVFQESAGKRHNRLQRISWVFMQRIYHTSLAYLALLASKHECDA